MSKSTAVKRKVDDSKDNNKSIDDKILTSVYGFLMNKGHKSAAQALIKEAGSEIEKKFKADASKVEDLKNVFQIFESHKRPRENEPESTSKKSNVCF